MGYKVASRIKTGSKDDGFEYLERGEAVDKNDVDDFDELLAEQSIVSDEEYARQFPDQEEGVNQPTGTPSNLADTEGTPLEADPETGAGDSSEFQEPKDDEDESSQSDGSGESDDNSSSSTGSTFGQNA